MRLYILTIVLDGMPFLPMQLNTLNRLQCDWLWMIVEGVSANTNCTSWCRPIEARYSMDGSHEFITNLFKHPRVKIMGKKMWNGGKLEMCNAPLPYLKQPGLLLQMDADELWSHDQLDRMSYVLPQNGPHNVAQFKCRYFVGPNLITVGDKCYGNNPGEWVRLWKYRPGMRFVRHEPPVMGGLVGGPSMVTRTETEKLGMVFDHWSYVFESQVLFKQRFYGYENAVEQWRRLQSCHGPWPLKLKTFLPWVDDRAMVRTLF